MKPYANLSGKSGVVAYELQASAILVRFRDGDLYEYNEHSAGRAVVLTMQQLARAGRGLSSFITQRKPGFVRR